MRRGPTGATTGRRRQQSEAIRAIVLDNSPHFAAWTMVRTWPDRCHDLTASATLETLEVADRRELLLAREADRLIDDPTL